ncbi:MAG: hypothetical protein GOU97_01730 [Nanoarchaeota archaeon]|nr:hypothetical protein [Nanoarchaeota archaeon]
MRKSVLFLVLFLFPSALGMTMTLVTPDSYPLQSNEALTLSITYYNERSSTVEDLSIGLTVDYPFKTVNGETYTRVIGQLKGLESTTQNYRVITYDNVPSNDYNLKPFWCIGTCSTKVSDNVQIRFSGEQKLQMISYSFSNDELSPSQETNFTIELKNFGTGKARDVIINVSNGQDGVIPFIFKDKPNYYYLGDIDAGKTESVTFNVRISKDLNPGVYAIPVQVKSDGETTNVGDLNFEIFNQADIRIAVIETDPSLPIEGQAYSLLVTLENVGQGKARSTKATLLGNMIGDTSSYIGVLEKDDSDVALFEILPGSDKIFQIEISYEDDLGQHTFTRETTIKLEQGERTNYAPIILLFFVIGIAYFFWKRKKRK